MFDGTCPAMKVHLTPNLPQKLMRFTRKSKIAGEQRSLQLADAMPQIIFTADADGLADYYNQRWFDYTCLTMEETEGTGWEQVIHPDDLQRTAEGWNEAVHTGRDFESDARFKCGSDGQYRWHLIRAVPVKDSGGKTLKWCGTYTDIDDQKWLKTRCLAPGMNSKIA